MWVIAPASTTVPSLALIVPELTTRGATNAASPACPTVMVPLLTIAAFGFAAFPNERWILLFAALFGLGYGGVLSTGWALAIDAMPQLRDIARDLGLWGIAQNLPPVVAPFAGWALLNHFGGTSSLFAYQMLFAVAGVCFLIGSASVLWVRGKPR